MGVLSCPKEAVGMPRMSILLAVALVAVITTISADNYDGIVPEKSGELLGPLDGSSGDLAESQISLAQVQKGAKAAAKIAAKQAQKSAAGAATKAAASAQKSAQKQAK